MEQKIELSDAELLKIAEKAIQKHFSQDELKDINLELKKQGYGQNLSSSETPAPEVVSVWINHAGTTHRPNSKTTAAANSAMWGELIEKGDQRHFLLFHRYPNDPATRRSAA